MLDFRPRRKEAPSSLSRNDKWRLLATIVASLMLLVIILRLGTPPTQRSLPAEPQGQAEEYNGNTLLIAIATGVVVVAASAVALFLFQGSQGRRHRASKLAGGEPHPELTENRAGERKVQGS